MAVNRCKIIQMRSKLLLLIVLGLFVVLGCTSYKRQVSPFKMPDAYSNVKEVLGAKVAAYAYGNNEDAERAFGFDISASGVLPIQVVFDNKEQNSFEIISAQTFLIDKENNIWPILEKSVVYERIAKKTEYAKIGSGAAKGGLLGGIGGGVIGAAIGIVTGESVLEWAGKGAAVGAAAGITYGGAQAITSDNAERKISEDLRNKSIENKVIPPMSITYGFVFFPGEAETAKELRLQLKETGTGGTYLLIFPLGNQAM
jgi:hypothetical protein